MNAAPLLLALALVGCGPTERKMVREVELVVRCSGPSVWDFALDGRYQGIWYFEPPAARVRFSADVNPMHQLEAEQLAPVARLDTLRVADGSSTTIDCAVGP